MKLASKLIAAVALTVVALTSQATIVTGDTVNVTHYYPDLSSSTDLGDQVVPTGIFDYYGLYEVTVSETYMRLISGTVCDSPCSVDTGDFNGPVLWNLTNALFTGVSIDASSTLAGFDAARLSFDTDHVYLNLQGLEMDVDSFLQINFSGNSVPEPESLALVGLALAGLVLTRRKAKQA